MLRHPKAVSKHLHELQGNPRSTKPVNKVECDTKNNTTTKAQQELKKKTKHKKHFYALFNNLLSSWAIAT